MKRTWQVERAALDELQNGRPCVLATILSLAGSAPRTAGAKMLVRADGSIVGTIGGGRLEAEVMAEAGKLLGSSEGLTMRFDLTGADAGSMDMICGGRLEALLEPLTPSPEAACPFETFLAAMDDGRRAARSFFILSLTPSAERAGGAGKRVRAARSFVTAGIEGPEVKAGQPLPADLLEALLAQAGRERSPTVVSPDGLNGTRFVVEPATPPGMVWLFGAGHVSQKLAHLAAFCGLRVAVLDDRAEFANPGRFPEADEILVPATFDGLLSDGAPGAGSTGLVGPIGPFGEDDCLVIVTRGHRHDKDILAQALRTGAGYIGMIGSRRKRHAVYEALRLEGFSDEDFRRVHCPIGLDVGAETPEEIAVSVMAELIQVRARREGE